jgi:hypothetical protein
MASNSLPPGGMPAPMPTPSRPAPQLKPVAGDRPGPLFTESVDARAKAANLTRLRSKTLASDDLECRVWVGFGLKPIEAFILTRTSGKWGGEFLESINQTTKPPYRRNISPAAGWDQFWNDLLDAGLFTLPDSSQLPDEAMVLDGTSYVVELRQGSVYRTYSYQNPDWQKWPEAKQMLRVAELLYSGFGVERYPPPRSPRQ